jgi:bisanhydrobacterioruberin hydratase
MDLSLLRQPRFWILFLSIFYLVGLIGIALPSQRALVSSLTPFHLLLTFFVLLINWKKKSPRFFLFVLLVYVLGMTAEWIGVHTGLLFGVYSYGQNLGAKLDGIPYVIGVNWVLMIFSSQAITRLWINGTWPVILVSALLMTLLDVAIEPVAIALDYWTWTKGSIPFYNYFCWFIVSIPMHYLYNKWGIHESNSVVKAVFLWMGVFFVILNFV